MLLHKIAGCLAMLFAYFLLFLSVSTVVDGKEEKELSHYKSSWIFDVLIVISIVIAFNQFVAGGWVMVPNVVIGGTVMYRVPEMMSMIVGAIFLVPSVLASVMAITHRGGPFKKTLSILIAIAFLAINFDLLIGGVFNIFISN